MSKNGPNSREGSGGVTFGSSTIRYDSNARKQSHVNPKLMMKLDHLKNLAVWASGVASVPPLSTFFGMRLAAYSESLGLRPDPSFVSCQRCESILQPGFNCTIRVEKNIRKAHHHHKNKKPRSNPQNHVVYTCHSCSYRNLMSGTARGYLKEICPRKDKLLTHRSSESTTAQQQQERQRPTKVTQVGSGECGCTETSPLREEADKSSPNESNNNVEPTDDPRTPSSIRVDISLLDSKRKRKRNKSGGLGKAIGSGQVTTATNNTNTTTKDVIDQSNNGTGRKRRRKTWTSLEEIAESSRHDHSKFANVAVPFLL